MNRKRKEKGKRKKENRKKKKEEKKRGKPTGQLPRLRLHRRAG